MSYINEVTAKKMERTAEALRGRGMEAYCVYSREELAERVRMLVPEGCSCASGGSMTLEESGIADMLRNGNYDYADRGAYTPDTMKECYLRAFSSDVYLMSSNAVTENGELYNVDGNGNRVAALSYGPASVVVIVGANKIVRDIDEAILRIKDTASPANTARLDRNTYCHHEGRCVSLTKNGSGMCDGCTGDERICCQYLVTGYSRPKGRIKVILTAESFGY